MEGLQRKIVIVAVVLVCIATFFVNNDTIAPDIMESRNIITAREMVYDGHWLVTTMNGDLRLEKPPLPTWCTAIAEILRPDSIAMQRSMAAVAALLMVFFFWKIARRVLKIDPLMPTLLLCTCYNVVLMGRTASWDIYCHAFMLGGIYFFALAWMEGPGRKAWLNMLAAGVMTGLSIMSKGPVSLYALFLPFLISFWIVYRPSMRGKWWALIAMIVVALVVGGWWYALIHFLHSDSLQAVVEKESGSWVNRNVRPWWYYWKFFLETGCWSLLLITAMCYWVPVTGSWKRDFGKISRPWLFSLAWMLASLILLSFLPEKKSRYLLPILIPAAYLMGCLILHWRDIFASYTRGTVADRVCFRINAYLLAAVVASLPALGWVFATKPGYMSLPLWIVLTVVCAAIAAWLIWSAIKLRPLAMVAAITMLFVYAECCVMPSTRNIINNPEMHSIAATRQIPALQGVPFYSLPQDSLRIELVYAANRKIRPLTSTAPDSLRHLMPFVILTHGPVGNYLPTQLWQYADSTYIDTYDDNRRPSNNKRHSPVFVYDAYLITPRQ
ncbi:MAG: glycosyltransferase family 39 protein [Bacteroidales bacterium]|nr:glycosyltransferase family 39 protein [Bacteroidales bacterium]